MLESEYQARLIKKLQERFPGCIVLKNDPFYLQGMLDLTVLFPGGFWAGLEVKRSARERKQPNQIYYVEQLDKICFGAFIYPENEEGVFRDLQRAHEAVRSTRFSEPK